MKRYEIRRFEVVLVGSFNPRILTPAWFSREGLLTAKEADSADGILISSDIARFELSWMRFEVMQGRFVMMTQQEPYFSKLVDLVAKTFSVLKHTPIRMVGLNSTIHYRFKSEEEYDALGDVFANRQIWAKTMNEPKLIKIMMKEGKSGDDFPGNITVAIEPSGEFEGDKGVQVYINDHYEICAKDDEYQLDLLIGVLEQANSSIEHSLELADKMVGEK